MTRTISVTLEDRRGNVMVRHVDLDGLTPEQHAACHEIIDHHVALAVESTGMHPDNVRGLFMVEAMERQADAEAYLREAQRRGVLAL